MAAPRSFLVHLLLVICCISGSLNGQDQSSNSKKCRFQAIFNFGDSNSDTGGISAVFYPIVMPYGQTFFGKAVGRASDGRLMVDFFADGLGLPYLSAYLNSVGANYRHGANFATGSSTIMMPKETFFQGGRSPFNLTGFGPPARICCGYFEHGVRIRCGSREVVNGTEILGGSSSNPSSFISWDGVHYTEAANYWLATRIMSGKYSDPPNPMIQACHEEQRG